MVMMLLPSIHTARLITSGPETDSELLAATPECSQPEYSGSSQAIQENVLCIRRPPIALELSFPGGPSLRGAVVPRLK